MLSFTTPNQARRRIGAVSLAVLAAMAGLGAWAAQPSQVRTVAAPAPAPPQAPAPAEVVQRPAPAEAAADVVLPADVCLTNACSERMATAPDPAAQIASAVATGDVGAVLNLRGQPSEVIDAFKASLAKRDASLLPAGYPDPIRMLDRVADLSDGGRFVYETSDGVTALVRRNSAGDVIFKMQGDPQRMYFPEGQAAQEYQSRVWKEPR